MVNMNDFAKEVALEEGGKEEISIAQIKEVVKVTLRKIAKMEDHELIKLLNRYGRNKS